MYLEKAQVLSSAGERLCLCKPGANNPERLQESQVLQLLCELGSLFPANGAGTIFFFHTDGPVVTTPQASSKGRKWMWVP